MNTNILESILKADGVKHEDMKDQIKKENTRRVRNILNSKLNEGNIISSISSRAVSIAKYGAGIISWTKMELEELDRKTRNLMTMDRGHYPKADANRLYLLRCEGVGGLIGLEDCVQVSTLKEKILKEVSRKLHVLFQNAQN